MFASCGGAFAVDCLHMKTASLLLAFTLAVQSGWPAPALGQTGAGGSPYEIRLPSDLTVLGVAGGVALVPVFLSDRIDRSCPCDPAGLNAIDRGTAGRQSALLRRLSNVPLIVAMALPVIPVLTDSEDRSGALKDALVSGQAIVINIAVNQIVKAVTERPRPAIYGMPADAVEIQEADNYRSFYSQHTSIAFASGISYARSYALRNPDSGSRWAVYAAAIGAGTATGALRVLSGQHFPTDVLAGAAAGTAFGLTVPWLHPKDDAARIAITPVPSGAVVSFQLFLD